jgi:hypothetical protein
MLTAIRSGQRPATPISRVAAALPDLPHLHRQRHRRVGAAAIISALAVLVAGAHRHRRGPDARQAASIMSRGDVGGEQAPDAAKT